MGILIKEVNSNKDLHDFIYLPEKIHKDHKNWVHPIYLDDETFFNPKTNRYFNHCDHLRILAEKNGEIVGRCMGLIHHDYNKDHNEKHARFSFIETYNDQEVFHALIEYISDWARSKGMSQLLGPLAFSDKDPQGFLIYGFDEINVLYTNCNFSYMINLIENEGFSKKIDLVEHKINIPDEIPPLYEKIQERFIKNNQDIRIIEFKNKIQLRPMIKPVLSLINETFCSIYAFTPFSEKEMQDFANRYIFLLNPKFIKVAVNEEGEVIGNIISMPDISKGIQKCKGRLLPFGLFQIFNSARKTKQINLMLGSIHPKYQGRGIDVVMAIKLIESAKKYGKTIIDSHLQLETNQKMRRESERIGGIVYKKYRIYQKDL